MTIQEERSHYQMIRLIFMRKSCF